MGSGWRTASRTALLALLGVVASGCELASVTTTPGEDVLVVEAVLRPDLAQQRILLHRTVSGNVIRGEPGARVVVTRSDGREVVFDQRSSAQPGRNEDFCATVSDPDSALAADSVRVEASCYLSPVSAGRWVRPGTDYQLRITTREGKQLRARTQVPAAFTLRSPALPLPGSQTTLLVGQEALCSVPPNQPVQLAWSPSNGAWAYLSELQLTGLAAALPELDSVPRLLKLTGLSISRNDTTVLFPSQFGLFERGEVSQPLLRALQAGLPPKVRALLILTATDRNYVNGVRGGTFNPSGAVRISSVSGDGVGIFASLVAIRVTLTAADGPASCRVVRSF